MDDLIALLETASDQNALDPLALCGVSSREEAPLSRFERLAGRVGAWAGGVAERWAFSSGPFFAFDGRLAAQYDDWRGAQRTPTTGPAPCPATPEA